MCFIPQKIWVLFSYFLQNYDYIFYYFIQSEAKFFHVSGKQNFQKFCKNQIHAIWFFIKTALDCFHGDFVVFLKLRTVHSKNSIFVMMLLTFNSYCDFVIIRKFDCDLICDFYRPTISMFPWLMITLYNFVIR